MKIIITLDELKDLCVHQMKIKGYDVKSKDITLLSHTEGQYGESEKVIDGLSVEVGHLLGNQETVEASIKNPDSIVGDDGRCRQCRAVQPPNKGVFGSWHEPSCSEWIASM